MSKNNILIESPYSIGDIVCHKLDDNKENKMIVTGIYVIQTNEEGIATYFTYDCCDANGKMQGYKINELQLIEKVEN